MGTRRRVQATYTPSDAALLRAAYHRLPVDCLATLLGQPARTIYEWGRRLGLARRGPVLRRDRAELWVAYYRIDPANALAALSQGYRRSQWPTT